MSKIFGFCVYTLLLGSFSFADTHGPSESDLLLSMYFDETQLVETATRVPKSITQVAENVTIITAEDIRRMHTHSVDDILNRVSGLFVNYFGHGFNNAAYSYIHGSNWEHVTAYLDGVKINKESNEMFIANNIPVHIIKRIEIIKGSASSTWGSSLGGVINIITKDTGNTEQPKGEITGSFGEYSTSDVTAEISGKTRLISYYAYAGNQDTNGIADNRYFENTNGYAKLGIDLTSWIALEFSSYYSRPDYLHEYFRAQNTLKKIDDENNFYSVKLDASLNNRLNMHWQAYRFYNDFTGHKSAISNAASLDHYENNQETGSITGRINYRGEKHSLVAGFDYRHNEIEFDYIYRNWASFYSIPDSFTNPLLQEDVFGLYINDSYFHKKWAITAGIRYDHVSTIASDQVNPSLGVTYLFNNDVLLRGVISRGFRKSPIWYLEGDPRYSPTAFNPDLEPEENWSYQFGFETIALPYCHVKTTLFFHDIENTWIPDSDWNPYRMNGGNSQRIGGEFEIRLLPIFDTSVTANFTYVHTDAEDNKTDDSCNANLIFQYDNPDFFNCELAGHWVNWGHLNTPDSAHPETNTFLWDFTVNKDVFRNEKLSVNLFGVVRNLFNGSQYSDSIYPNSPRWVEGGLKIQF